MIKPWLGVLLLCFPGFQALSQTPSVSMADSVTFLRNDSLTLGFDLRRGTFWLENARKERILDQACFQANGLQSKDSCTRSWSVQDIEDTLGRGKALEIRASFPDFADIIWQATLYEGQHYLVFRMGIDNDTRRSYTLRNFYPVSTKSLYPGKDVDRNYRVLDGNAGGVPTWVTDTARMKSFNNLLLRFGPPESPEILVAGGITYHEFEKFVHLIRWRQQVHFNMYAEDPVGKLIDPGTRYLPDERFYLCFVNDNPFEALENYATVLKKAQRIDLNYYDFPTECLWYANTFSVDKNRRRFNDSRGAVEEMDNAIATGITRFTKVGVRLVPDYYGPNNQQGWWDDEHWAKWGDKRSTDAGNYAPPYLTTESWSRAVIERGGHPFTYLQSARRSEDFVRQHPEWMLFNDPYKEALAPQRLYQELSYPHEYAEEYTAHFWSEKRLWSYDYTDTGYIRHVRSAYRKLRQAGIKGIFYDYPDITAWAYEGGFDDKYATTAYAYRTMFRLADEEMGRDAFLQERNIVRGSDIALGLIESQRVWADANHITAEMITRCGLRWYKNRKVINYDMDSKDPAVCLPKDHPDGSRAMFTMAYTVSGRFLLAPSFKQLSRQQLQDMSRTFPYHRTELSARPIDAFDQGVRFPKVYAFPISNEWQQLVLYNYELSGGPEDHIIRVAPGKSLNEGGLGLDPSRQYHLYDFWNDQYLGLVDGSGLIRQRLRPGEARVISVHARLDRPQFISTNRHIMQGYLDLQDVRWDAARMRLSGKASVVEGDPFTIVIAPNGYRSVSAKADQGTVQISTDQTTGLTYLTIRSGKNADIKWELSFRK